MGNKQPTRINSKLYAIISKMAQEEGRTVEGQIEVLLKKALDKKQK